MESQNSLHQETQSTPLSSIIKALRQEFLINKTIDNSLLELLCHSLKVNASTSDQNTISQHIHIVNKELLSILNSKKVQASITLTQQFYNLVNILFFNLSAINEHQLKQIQNDIIESTASQSVPSKHQFQKMQQQNIEKTINFVKQQIRSFFSQLMETDLVSEIVELSFNKKGSHSGSGIVSAPAQLTNLLQTFDYICVKYQIENRVSDKIITCIEKHSSFLQNSSKMFHSSDIKEVNKRVFSTESLNDLFYLIETDPSLNYKKVIAMIDCNYEQQQPKRKIFSHGDIVGKQVIQKMFKYIVKRVSKNELFTQKLQEEYTLFKAFIYHTFDKLIMASCDKNSSNNQEYAHTMKEIEKFFRIELTINNSRFTHLIQFMHSTLTQKYSAATATELMKKFLLNRFLLNPSFYVLYFEPSSQNQIARYVQTANQIRILFYSHKVEEYLNRNHGSGQFLPKYDMKKVSTQIQSSLLFCMQASQQSSKKSLLSSPLQQHGLYINDKIMKNRMSELSEQLKAQNRQSHPENSKKTDPLNIQNLLSDQSLSFSFVKPIDSIKKSPDPIVQSKPLIENVSEVKLQEETHRSNNVTENLSIRIMYDQLKHKSPNSKIFLNSPSSRPSPEKRFTNKQSSEEKSESAKPYIADNTSENIKANETHATSLQAEAAQMINDRQIIEELIEKRKEYGEKRRNIEKRCQERRKNREIRFANQCKAKSQFENYRSQVEKSANLLYIELSIN